MKIIFGAYILGVFNFGIIVLVMFLLDNLPLTSIPKEYQIYLILGNLVFLVLMTFISHNVYVNRTKKAKTTASLSEKIAVYRLAKIIQISVLEAVALLSLVLLMLDTHIAFLVFAVLSMVQMIRVFPQKSNMIEDLELNYSDQQNLNNPDFLLD